jgi:hypothetical protein
MLLLCLSLLLATFQLIAFDHAIATSTAGFTDDVANDTTVFTPLIDNTILAVILLLALVGVTLSFSKPKMLPLRILLAIFITGLAYFAFELIEVGIQQHLSGFKGV